MTVVAWIVEGTWPAVVDAARTHAAAEGPIVLLHVTEPGVAGLAHGAYAGLLGRARRDRDPGTRLEELGATGGADLLQAAAERLGLPCERQERAGRPEREVVTAAEGADLLVVARDGDRTRLGPKSLGPAARFAVDHAPCPVLLVWPDAAPQIHTLPPHPPHPHGPA
jgi:nucleotide-binding universal stress UspA family protein